MDPDLFDKRVVQRYLRDGTITKKQYEDYLKKLPDVADLVDKSPIEFVTPNRSGKKNKPAIETMDEETQE